jgi:dephospho-CoA kinase
MNQPPLRLGLTGSIATGKTTVANMFAIRGVPLFSADRAVHALYEGPLADQIGALFPKAFDNGKLDRTRLGEIVFGDKDALARLEQLVHPAVRAKMDGFIAEHIALGTTLVVLDIPLLFEARQPYPTHKVAVTWCDENEQKRRVLARPGMTEEKFYAILDRQTPQSEKRARADFEIDTNQSLEMVAKQVEDIIVGCTGRPGR